MDDTNPYASPGTSKGGLPTAEPTPADGMLQYEYKHVRMNYGWGIFSKRRYHDRLMSVLEPLGREGWELKGVFHEGFELHIHMVFARRLTVE